MNDTLDVIIVGGGLVGASLAIALDGSGLRVALAEAVPARASAQPSYDERNLALARASLNALGALGVLDDASAAPTPIKQVVVTRRSEFGSLRLDAAALGLPAFGAVLPARELGNALLRRLDRYSALIRWAPAELVALEAHADAIAVTMRTPDGERRHRTRLLVGADGSESFVRGACAIGVVRNDYEQCAFVTTVTTERALGGCAFERFTDSGPIALLPLAGQRAGLVLTVTQTDVDEVAALDDEAFVDLVHRRFGYRAGRLSRPGRRKPYPLRRVLADSVIAPRAVLVGNAAQTLHPIGAQGFNLGLRDALTLAELLRETDGAQTDCGDVALLRRHAERRATDRRQTIAFSDDLVRLMGNPFLPLRVLRSLGFLALDRVGPLKRRFALRGMGFRGDAPSLTLSTGQS
ncbi:MAG: 2-octaprenyl-6-methoxyphenyl hydroxylase [Rhodanobacteraceae bacterium]